MCYLCIYIYMYVYIYIYIYIYLSLSLSIYIYIYIHMSRLPRLGGAAVRKTNLCRPVQNSDSEFSVRRLTLVCRCWVSPETKKHAPEGHGNRG